MIAADLDRLDLVADLGIPEQEIRGADYFGLGREWFGRPVAEAADLHASFLRLAAELEDFATYLRQLCSLHLRRLKYQLILQHQPLPQMDQVVPRSLLEFGGLPADVLASWLVWRKWIYDLDNRAAQETGLLFEPILAASLGGVRYSDKTSPVRRVADRAKGRQVDCLTDEGWAYEFKLRVTIAASGQGRFPEELAYAEDCRASGYAPVLLVLDPTPSNRLDDLEAAYRAAGGEAFIGQAAWQHLRERSGPTMATFVERYVRRPLTEVEASHAELLPVQLVREGGAIRLSVGMHTETIDRTVHDRTLLDALAEDTAEDAEDTLDG